MDKRLALLKEQRRAAEDTIVFFDQMIEQETIDEFTDYYIQRRRNWAYESSRLSAIIERLEAQDGI